MAGSRSDVSSGSDRLGAIVDVQFGEDVGDMVAHGAFTEMQLGRDRRVAHAAGEEFEHVALSWAQLWECI